MKVYSLLIGHTTFYYHDACLDIADKRNVNNLSPEQLQEDMKHFKETEEYPDNVKCNYCHKEIKNNDSEA